MQREEVRLAKIELLVILSIQGSFTIKNKYSIYCLL